MPRVPVSSVKIDAPAAQRRRQNPARLARSEQRKRDQISQLEKFLDIHTQANLKLPRGPGGRVSLDPVLQAAGLSTGSKITNSGLRTAAQEYADKFGLCTVQEFKASLPTVAPTVRPPSEVMTYNWLLEMDSSALSVTPLKAQSLTTYRSVLRRFVEYHGKNVADRIGPELIGDFDASSQNFIQHEFKGKTRLASSAMSCLSKYQEAYARHQRTDGLPVDLGAALKQLVKQDGRAAQVLSRAIGQRHSYISTLILGKQRTASRDALTRLEEILSISQGTLTSRALYRNPRHSPLFCLIDRFPIELQGKSNSWRRELVKQRLPDDFPERTLGEQDRLFAYAVHQILNGHHLDAYGRRQAENIKLVYVLKEEDFPERLQEEFNSISQMKRAKGSMGKPDRTKRWRPGGQNHWSSAMCRFLGWCLLPVTAADERMRGPGLSRDDLTLGLIVSPTLIDGYLAFRRARTDGMDSKTSDAMLTNASSMLYPGQGWVEGHSNLAQRLPASLQPEIEKAGGWTGKCAEQRQYLLDLRAILDFGVSRDTFRPILPMIEMGRPLDLVQQALHNHRQELKAAGQRTDLTDAKKAAMWRDHLLISMLAALPLRASHWQNMTFSAADQSLYSSGGGQLRHVRGEDWGLYLRAQDFKNAKNKVIFGPKGDQDVYFLLKDAVNALDSVEPLLDHYMRVHRPFLCPGDGPVFPDYQGAALTEDGLYAIVSRWTEKYLSEHGDQQYGLRLKGVLKFGPHAFRHLVATHVLLTTGSYEDAANMLLDSPEMVHRHYGLFLPGNRLLSSMKRIDTWKAPTWTL